MIKSFNQYISESKDSDYLLYYAFDWDDNIMNMPTVIRMEKKVGDTWEPIDVTTAEFSQVRTDKDNYRLLENNPGQAFVNFRDEGPSGGDIFLMDVKKAVSSGSFGPAWKDFIECLTSGSLFAIITARGHEAPSMKKGVAWIIDNVLTEEQLFEMYNYLVKYSYHFGDYFSEDFPRILKGQPSQNPLVKKYLDSCEYIGVSAPSRGGSPDNPEKAKEEALLTFVDRMNSYAERLGLKAKIGFSDDDLKNVKHIEDLVDNIHKERFSNVMSIVVKGTKDPERITTKVRVFETSQQTPGLESSVLKFTQFGNMTGHLYPSDQIGRQDDGLNSFKRATKYLSQTSKEILKNKKKNKKKRD